MSIRPVDLSGMIQRTQDIGNIKHAEDSRILNPMSFITAKS